MFRKLAVLLKQSEAGYALAVYRIAFGLLMAFSLLRFMAKGWVEDCYIAPSFHFTYQYFHWIKPILWPEWTMYGIVGLGVVSALSIAVGFYYRIAAITFFLVFSYLELIEQSWYLNHYYFISVVAFLLCWFPADHRWSYRAWRSQKPLGSISAVYTTALKLQISLVYFYAGLAKLNYDWLVQALPLKIWLKARIDLPVLGDLLAYDSTAYFFSYAGAAYDLSIAFLLWNKRTRPIAFIGVLLFHTTTAVLFQIGMFPWIMIMGSLIFIEDGQWRQWYSRLKGKPIQHVNHDTPAYSVPKWLLIVLVAHFSVQVFLPLRKWGYSENQHWTERHFRFGWNVMLIEKNGFIRFKVKDPASKRTYTEYPSDYLSITQENKMAYQPDMIWQFAKYLEEKYRLLGIESVEVYVDNKVTYNRRPSQVFIPDSIDVVKLSEDAIYDFVAPLESY